MQLVSKIDYTGLHFKPTMANSIYKLDALTLPTHWATYGVETSL